MLRKYDEHNLDIDETIFTEPLEHDNLRVLGFKILEKSEKWFIPILFILKSILLKLYFQIWSLGFDRITYCNNSLNIILLVSKWTSVKIW